MNGQSNYERSGAVHADGDQLTEGIRAHKAPGFSGAACGNENIDPGGRIQKLAGQ